ncbi:MAG: GNAT family N-acetyltransferase [Urechidicola sp.]|nr:GNAT family N-acetyltransferase [Urechidicola sp.]
MIQLEKFESKEDILRLIKWVDSTRLNIIWASDKFTFPLDEDQLVCYLNDAKKNNILIFKVLEVINNKAIVVGHAELDIFENDIKISRLLIDKTQRGKGYGEQMVKLLIKYIHKNLNHTSIFLTVFTFNKPAIALYEKLGFETVEIDPDFMSYESEIWDRQKMILKN